MGSDTCQKRTATDQYLQSRAEHLRAYRRRLEEEASV